MHSAHVIRFAAMTAVAAALGCGGGSSSPTGAVNNPPPVASGTSASINIQTGFVYSPRIDTVKVGTAVKWTNIDNIAHTVTSDTQLWDSGQLGPPNSGGPYGGGTGGATYSHTFDQTGSFSYHCLNHPPSAYPNFTGTVVVIE